MSRRFLRQSLLACLALPVVAGACAKQLPDATPAELPEIRRELDATPDDPELRTRLGIALYRSGDIDGAVDVLQQLVDEGTDQGAAYLFLGLALEDREEWGAAREAYQTYLATGRYEPLKAEMRDRLTYLARQEVRRAAQEAVAREAELTAAGPEPRTVAVLPFQMGADAPELEPLRFALADIIITDLGLSNDVRVLERGQIQALLDEMALTEAGMADEATGARAGRILRAENVIQGALTPLGDDQLQILADVVNTSQGEGVGSASDEDALEALFEMEKVIVFQLLDVLGVDLTPAEREAISENRVESLQAFLTYGQGLQALDQGAFSDAAALFSAAAQIEPGFNAANARASEASSLQQASNTSPQTISARSGGELQGGVIGPPADEAGPAGGLLASVDDAVNPTPGAPVTQGETGNRGSSDGQATGQDPGTESTGSEGSTTSTRTLRIPISNPTRGGNIIIRLPIGGIR